MEEKAKKKLTVKGLLKALLVVLLILVILSLIIILGGKGNKKDNAIIRGESGTKSLVVYFSQADVVDLDKTDAVSSASMRKDNSRNVYGNTEYVARLFQQATGGRSVQYSDKQALLRELSADGLSCVLGGTV